MKIYVKILNKTIEINVQGKYVKDILNEVVEWMYYNSGRNYPENYLNDEFIINSSILNRKDLILEYKNKKLNDNDLIECCNIQNNETITLCTPKSLYNGPENFLEKFKASMLDKICNNNKDYSFIMQLSDNDEGLKLLIKYINDNPGSSITHTLIEKGIIQAKEQQNIIQVGKKLQIHFPTGKKYDIDFTGESRDDLIMEINKVDNDFSSSNNKYIISEPSLTDYINTRLLNVDSNRMQLYQANGKTVNTNQDINNLLLI